MFIFIGATWFFFFPNAPYLVTDLLHVFVRYSFDPTERFWIDVVFWQHLFTLFTIAILGVLLGSYSLFSVQSLVRISFGVITSWIFVIVVLILSSFGIYIGRFVRWNSSAPPNRYARVSASDQSMDLQIDSLKSSGCDRIFEGKVSGKKCDRPELARCLEYLRSGDSYFFYGIFPTVIQKQRHCRFSETRSVNDFPRELRLDFRFILSNHRGRAASIVWTE